MKKATVMRMRVLLKEAFPGNREWGTAIDKLKDSDIEKIFNNYKKAKMVREEDLNGKHAD